jgi:hypothetical protein
MVGSEKATGDAKRIKQMQSYIQETGNNPAPPEFVQTPADDIEPSKVDPRLLTGQDPVFDNLSLVTVEVGSCFATGQEQVGVGVSCFAPPLARSSPAAATATSGALEKLMSQDNSAAHCITGAQDPPGLILDVGHERWAHDLLDASMTYETDDTGLRHIPFNTSTPRANDTFSTVNITPIRTSTTSDNESVRSPVLTAKVSVPLVTSNGDVPQRRLGKKRKPVAASQSSVPKTSDAVLEMATEKTRLARIVASETIRLERITATAKVEVAKQEALFWALRRKGLVEELLAKGVTVDGKFSQSEGPLLSGALANDINAEMADRIVLLMVMHNSWMYFLALVYRSFFLY